jgi:hypothetical protein
MLFTVNIMILLPSRYRFWLALPIVHYRDTTVPHRPTPYRLNFER